MRVGLVTRGDWVLTRSFADTESATDFVKEKADAAASYVQPEANKSFGQKTADTFGSSTNSSSFGVSDTGRQSAGDKFSSAITPDSQKSCASTFTRHRFICITETLAT